MSQTHDAGRAHVDGATPSGTTPSGKATEAAHTDESSSTQPGRDADHDVEGGADGHSHAVDAAIDPRSREELLTELLEAESRRDEYLDDVRRARAELDNFRKRTLREAGQQRELGKAEVVGALLEVLDDLDRTVEVARASNDDALAKGVTLVADKLATQLRSIGLERVDATDEPFDPTCHEAVQQQPADPPVDHPVVAQVLRPGYRLGDRVVRAAMVIVAQ